MSTIDTSSLLSLGSFDFGAFESPPPVAPMPTMSAMEPSDDFAAAGRDLFSGDFSGAGGHLMEGLGSTGRAFSALFDDVYKLPAFSGTDSAPGITGPVLPALRAVRDALGGVGGGWGDLGAGFSQGFDGGFSRSLLGLGGGTGEDASGVHDIGRSFGSIFANSPFGMEDAAVLGIARHGSGVWSDLPKLDRFDPPPNGWMPKPFDQKADTIHDAIDQAFNTLGLPREEFTITQWGRDGWGKSHPVEWFHPSTKAEVNIDFDPFALDGPQSWHVGLKMPGGDRSLYPPFGYVRHIEVPAPTVLGIPNEGDIYYRLRLQ